MPAHQRLARVAAVVLLLAGCKEEGAADAPSSQTASTVLEHTCSDPKIEGMVKKAVGRQWRKNGNTSTLYVKVYGVRTQFPGVCRAEMSYRFQNGNSRTLWSGTSEEINYTFELTDDRKQVYVHLFETIDFRNDIASPPTGDDAQNAASPGSQ